MADTQPEAAVLKQHPKKQKSQNFKQRQKQKQQQQQKQQQHQQPQELETSDDRESSLKCPGVS